jgi:hypothetical protein
MIRVLLKDAAVEKRLDSVFLFKNNNYSVVVLYILRLNLTQNCAENGESRCSYKDSTEVKVITKNLNKPEYLS